MVTCFNAFSCQRVYVAGLIPSEDYNRELRNASQNCSFGDVCYTWECAKSVDSSRVLHDMKMGNTPLRTWCYMNTCTAPHLKISPKHFSPKHFTVAISIALASASEQTRCFWYHVMLNDQLALPKAALFNFFYNIHWLVVTWLVPHGTAAISAYILCTLYSHAPVYSIIFSEATYVGCMCVWLYPVNLYLGQNDHDLLSATAVTQGSAQKVGPGEDNSPAIPNAGTWTCDLLIMNLALHH